MKSRLFLVVPIVLLALALFAPPVLAGDLNPPGPPGPTMKTLDQIPPTWSIKLPCNATTDCPRFVILPDFSSEAVLDKETGLVWEKSPDTNLQLWGAVQAFCVHRVVGYRKGWRVPSVEELASLLDMSNYPRLPIGHPFTNVQYSYGYWSATIVASATSNAWSVSMLDGVMYSVPKSQGGNIWCVRGGHGYDGQ